MNFQEFFCVKLFNIVKQSLMNLEWTKFASQLVQSFFQKFSSLPFHQQNNISIIFKHFFIFELDYLLKSKNYRQQKKLDIFLHSDYIEIVIVFIKINQNFIKEKAQEINQRNFKYISMISNNMSTFTSFLDNYFELYRKRPNTALNKIMLMFKEYQNYIIACLLVMDKNPSNQIFKIFFKFLNLVNEISELNRYQNISILDEILTEFTKYFPEILKETFYNEEFLQFLESIIRKTLISTTNPRIISRIKTICQKYHLDFNTIQKSIPFISSPQKQHFTKKIYYLDWNTPYDPFKDSLPLFYIFYYLSLIWDKILRKEEYDFQINSEKIYHYGKLRPLKNPLLKYKKIPITNLRLLARYSIKKLVLICVITYILFKLF